MNTPPESKTLYTIGFRIVSEPWAEIETANAHRNITQAFAFCELLTYRIESLLRANMSLDGFNPISITFIRSGFIGRVNVVNLQAGLFSIQSLIHSLHLSKYCQIVTKSPGNTAFMHYSGPAFAPFESYLEEVAETIKTMQDAFGAAIPKP